MNDQRYHEYVGEEWQESFHLVFLHVNLFLPISVWNKVVVNDDENRGSDVKIRRRMHEQDYHPEHEVGNQP